MNENRKVALITGAAQRIGATIARALHARGYNIIIHYYRSIDAANKLTEELNRERDNSAVGIQGKLVSRDDGHKVADAALAHWGRIDALINNASSFYPTPIEKAGEDDWEQLIGSNLKSPFFLTQRLAPTLKANCGCVVNIIDIHADKPLRDHPIYCMAKAGLAMMTKTLAKDLAPEIRVNGVSPGAILWPENEPNDDSKQAILTGIPLGKLGESKDIALTVVFLVADAPYISGQILAVDGGRSLS